MQELFKTTMLDHPDVLENLPKAFEEVFVSGDISLSDRLKVYRSNIVGSLTDTLITAFPLLEQLVGREFLEQTARAFVLENPPDTGCLNTYGRGFDLFLKTYKPAETLPYLSDVAAFEIAMTESYYAIEDTPLTTEGLAAINPETLSDTVLSLRQSAFLVSSLFPLTAIRDFCHASKEGKEQGTFNLNQGGVDVLVYRPENDVLIVNLEPDEFMMLKCLSADNPLGESLGSTLHQYPDFDIHVFLQRHLSLKTFKCSITAEVV